MEAIRGKSLVGNGYRDLLPSADNEGGCALRQPEVNIPIPLENARAQTIHDSSKQFSAQNYTISLCYFLLSKNFVNKNHIFRLFVELPLSC